MGQVTVRVNGYAHTIGCKDGEEAHVLELASRIETKTRLIRGMGGQFSEARMLLHVALLLADEANDLRIEVDRLSAGAAVAGLPGVPVCSGGVDPEGWAWASAGAARTAQAASSGRVLVIGGRSSFRCCAAATCYGIAMKKGEEVACPRLAPGAVGAYDE